jgi:hypothetical protein
MSNRVVFNVKGSRSIDQEKRIMKVNLKDMKHINKNGKQYTPRSRTRRWDINSKVYELVEESQKQKEKIC